MSFSVSTLARYGPNNGLATHPLLVGLRRAELRRWGQAADQVELAPGDVLLHEAYMGHWFFLIESGTVAKTKLGITAGELGPGDHVGEVAILGLGPQPATITASTTVRAFVVGRRHFVALVHDMPVIQQRLFPDLGDGGLNAKLRELRAAATAEWKAVARARQATAATRKLAPAQLYARPWRVSRSPSVSWPTLPGVLFTLRPPRVEARRPLPWAVRMLLAVGITCVAALAAWAYHPPMIVVHPLPAIDVSRDIAVTGVPVHPVHGRYLLLTVKLERPNVFGAVRAVLAHDRRLPLHAGPVSNGPGGPNSAEAFRRSQTEAAAAAAMAAGFDVRPRGDGALVVDALGHGGANELRPGDVIVAVDHRPVAIAPDVLRLVAEQPPGAVSTLTVERDGARVDANLTRTSDEVRTGRLRLMLDTRNATFSMPFRVTFRRRPIGGPSGGLVYALALADMLGAGDLAHGRTIAATGAINPTGDVIPVGFVAEKSASVRRARATELLVPTNQVVDAARSSRPVHGVLTLADAIQSLEEGP